MRRSGALILTLAITLAVGCGGDGGDVTSRTAPPTITGPPSELLSYCEATISLWIILYNSVREINLALADEVDELTQQRGVELQLLVAGAQDEAPEEIRDELAVLGQAIDVLVATGDIRELEAPDVVPAREEVNDFNTENCGWPSLRLAISRQGEILGMPSRLGLGFYIFELRNDSDLERQLDLYVEEEDAPPGSVADRFSSAQPIEPEGVELKASVLVPAGGTTTHVGNLLSAGEYAFVLADPAQSSGGIRQFVSGTVKAFRVVEDG